MGGLADARISLEGLSVGDAFGQRFFVYPSQARAYLEQRVVPQSGLGAAMTGAAEGSLWRYTDDTQMALSVYRCLSVHGRIDQGWLIRDFHDRYDARRGYGAAMHKLLGGHRLDRNWRRAAQAIFDGMGSYGNGAAMRVAPVGAYCGGDPETAAQEARKSAEVTHAHKEGVAGAIAVAVAASLAVELRDRGAAPDPPELIERVLPFVPDGRVAEGLKLARKLASTQTAASLLGTGYAISAQDTVPFCVWCAATYLSDYEEALWQTASGLGDVDTTCAIVGGIVACYTGMEGIQPDWLLRREPLPDWAWE